MAAHTKVLVISSYLWACSLVREKFVSRCVIVDDISERMMVTAPSGDGLRQPHDLSTLSIFSKAFLKFRLSSSTPGLAAVCAPTNLIESTSLRPSLAALKEVLLVASMDRYSVLGVESARPVSF